MRDVSYSNLRVGAAHCAHASDGPSRDVHGSLESSWEPRAGNRECHARLNSRRTRRPALWARCLRPPAFRSSESVDLRRSRRFSASSNETVMAPLRRATAYSAFFRIVTLPLFRVVEPRSPLLTWCRRRDQVYVGGSCSSARRSLTGNPHDRCSRGVVR